jgi:hypothetical protein
VPDFLLLESGAPDNLLLESGDNLLLDDGTGALSAALRAAQLALEVYSGGEEALARASEHILEAFSGAPSVETTPSQIVLEVFSTASAETYASQIVLEVFSRRSEFLPVFLGTFGPLCWIEFDDPNGNTYVFAPTQLNDPITYYHGPKWGTILSFDRVTRALSSDDDGSIEGQRWGATFSDTTRYWRGVLGRPDITRLILNRKVRLRMISNEGRVNLETPRTVALGLLTTYGTN